MIKYTPNKKKKKKYSSKLKDTMILFLERTY